MPSPTALPLKTDQPNNATSLYADDAERSEELKTRDSIAALCVKQAQASLKYKERRVQDWNENINLYDGVKAKETADGRFDYPLPIMSGFIDTSMSNIKDEPIIEYDHVSFADKKRAKKVTAAWRFYSSPSQMDWATVDLDVKKIAHFTGVGIYKMFFESDPGFNGYLEAIDPFDYLPEPLGGGDLWKHNCGFQDNIFRSKYELENSKHYNAEQVKRLIAACASTDTSKLNKLEHRAKLNRFAAMGLKYDAVADYQGDNNYRLTEGFTTYQGKKWYVFMDLQTGIWVRIEPLKEVFKSNKPMFVGWQTHRDAFNFLSKAPADDIRPIAIGMRRIFNEAMYNINKRNSGSRAYDPEIFEEPELLQWRPDGLVPATVPAGKAISSGIYEFKTEDNTAITVNLMNFLDNFVGQKTGITPGTQGQSPNDIKVGVYFGDLQRVAARFGLTNKYYAKAWHDLGYLFAWGLWEHMPQELMVKVIGEEGVEWEELLKEDTEPDFAIIVRGGSSELQADELKKKTKADSLGAMANSPLYGRLLNPRLVAEETLRNGGWDEETIKRFMDLNNLGDEDSLINAAQAIQDVLEGKEPRMYRKATLAFLSKIEDFLATQELDLDKEVKLFAYFNKMQPIVVRNMTRRAMNGGPTLVLPGMFPNNVPTPGMGAPERPTPPTPGGNPPNPMQ